MRNRTSAIHVIICGLRSFQVARSTLPRIGAPVSGSGGSSSSYSSSDVGSGNSLAHRGGHWFSSLQHAQGQQESSALQLFHQPRIHSRTVGHTIWKACAHMSSRPQGTPPRSRRLRCSVAPRGISHSASVAPSPTSRPPYVSRWSPAAMPCVSWIAARMRSVVSPRPISTTIVSPDSVFTKTTWSRSLARRLLGRGARLGMSRSSKTAAIAAAASAARTVCAQRRDAGGAAHSAGVCRRDRCRAHAAAPSWGGIVLRRGRNATPR